MAKVLVVEDNPTLLESIAFELEMRDYAVVQATNGVAAVRILEESSPLPDIIVSDIAMPDMDGYQLLEQVRQSEIWQGIPVIFLTAFDSKNAIRIGKGLGIDDYLVKPFDPDDLIIAVENKLKRTQDIHKQAERRLDETRHELMNLIAHELRTPLTTIYGSTEMLERSLTDVPDELTQHLLQLLRSGSNRLYRLVERIVSLVQIESGQLKRIHEMKRTECDLNTLVIKAVKPFADSFQERHIELEIKLTDKPLVVQGLERMLELVVGELVDNALKFSESDGTVVLETTQHQNHARLEVRDTGRGIPKDSMSDIWERFVQIDREEYEQQGIGIGLTLVREIVATHNGEVTITSEVGEGTTVVVLLPLVKTTT